MLTGIISVAEFRTKDDMSRWTRAHASAAGINWTTAPGETGAIRVIEHEADRRDLSVPAVMATVPATATARPSGPAAAVARVIEWGGPATPVAGACDADTAGCRVLAGSGASR